MLPLALERGYVSQVVGMVFGMESNSAATGLAVEKKPIANDLAGFVAEAVLASGEGFVVRVARRSVDGLSLDELDDRIEELGRARARIEGCLAEVLAERARRSSNREAAAVLRERVLESAGRASGEVKTAVSLAENFPSTLKALIGGEINSGHARVINRVAGKPDYRGEEEILGSARVVPSDLLSRYALRHTPVEERDYSKYQQQRQDRRAMMTQEPDGPTVAKPTSTTSYNYATAATTSPTTPTGKSTKTTKADTTSNPHPTHSPTPQQPPTNPTNTTPYSKPETPLRRLQNGFIAWLRL